MKKGVVIPLAVFAIYLVLLMCLGNNTEDFRQCYGAVLAHYPQSKTIPMGRPYSELYECMRSQGYALDVYPGHCDDGQDALIHQMCYRPTNPITGYFFDIRLFLR
jgi:hypothetical protein